MYLHILAVLSLAVVVHADFNDTLLPWQGYSVKAMLSKHVINLMTEDPALLITRPVDNANDILKVAFTIRVKQILSFDATDQMLNVFAWKSMNWVNNRVGWNASLFDGFDQTAVQSFLIWTPDLIMLNAVHSEMSTDGNMDIVQVNYNNIHQFSAPFIYRIPCAVDMFNFPFDIQHCTMVFGSWSFGDEEIEWESYHGTPFLNIADHIPNQEWLIVDSIDETIKRDRRGKTYDEVHMTVALKRYSGFYFQFVLIPTLLLATLILTIFWIPPSRPDRTGLGMSVFGGLMLLLLMVVRISPPSTDVKIGTYYCVNIVLVVMSTAFSALVVSISSKNSKLPTWLRTVFVTGIGRFLGISQQFAIMYPCADDNDPHQTIIRDWQIIAVICDRMFFTGYLITVVICVSLYFPFPEEHQAMT